MFVSVIKECGTEVLLTTVGWGEGKRPSPCSPFLGPPPVRGLLGEHWHHGCAGAGRTGKPAMGEAEASVRAHVCTRGRPGRTAADQDGRCLPWRGEALPGSIVKAAICLPS